MKKARHTSVLWARRVLLVLSLGVVAGIVALYLLGRQQRSEGFGEKPEEGEGRLGAVRHLVGKGFDIDLTDEGRTVASISASRLVAERQDTTFLLEDVHIEATRESGGVYRISSREATYNMKANTADLEGEVRIEGPDGMSLSAEGLQMRRHGRTVVSTGPVSFSLGPNYLGSARQLDANLRRDEFVLAGDVQVRSVTDLRPGVALDSQRAAYDRKQRILRAEGDVDLRHGEDRVQARRLTVHLAEDERTIVFAQGLWEVRAVVHEISDDGLPQRIAAEADQLTVELDDLGRPERMELDSGPHPVARVRLTDATGLVRTFEAGFIDGVFAAGRLSRLSGNESVQLVETLDLEPQPLLRRLCGDDLEATLDAAGRIDAFSLDGTVDYTEPWSQAETRSMERDRETGEIVLTGEGTWMARQGVRLESPHVVVDPETEELHATEGVRADMEQQRGLTLGVGEEGRQEPVHVVSAEATYHPVEGFRFIDDVRAWQGRNYMLARTFGGTGERVTAEGSVKTVWHDAAQPGGGRAAATEPAPEGGAEETAPAGGSGLGAERREADAEDAQQPLEVFAQQLVWENATGLVEYQGAARAQQGRRNMRCANIRVHLDDENEVELMECDGPVQIEDPVGGNKVYGDAAEYRPGSDSVLVLGEPVRLVDRTGAEFKGKAMRYDFTTGRAELDSLSGRESEPFGTVPGEEAEPAAGEVVDLIEGRSFLVARLARSDEDHLTVRGPLRLSFQPVEPPAAAEPPDAESPTEEGEEGATAAPPAAAPAAPAEPEPIELYAVTYDYDRDARLLALEGGIRFRQGSRSLRCARLELRLTEDYRVERVECRGSAQLQETASGDVLSGAVALYDPASGEVEVTGSPARLRRSSGVESEASSIVYELGTGRVEMGGTEEEPEGAGDAPAPDGGR